MENLSSIALLIYLGIIVVWQASLWKTFVKAGRTGWAAIIPIYNISVMLEIVNKPIWWLFLLLVPCVNFIVAIIIYHELSKAFGKGVGTTLLLVFGVGFVILGFGDATYQGAKPSARAI
jgi:phosphoglycerol transferase MdoB-like AlkP superfamily enzyme